MGQLGSLWNTMSRRDRRLLVFMVVSLTLFIGYFVVTGVRAKVRSLETSVTGMQRDLNTMNSMLADLDASRGRIADIEKQLGGFANFSVSGFLQTAGEETKISDNIKGINDEGLSDGVFFDEHAYEVVLKKVTLEQLVNYLYKIQSAPQPLRISRLVVRANTRNREELSANVTVVFSKLKAEEG